MDKVANFFGFNKLGTDFRTEVTAGSTTFMTMSYIIFVQPAILSTAGMDGNAVMVATCIASALATFLMGILANYPVALAPAMGHNVFFAVVVCGVMGFPWQVALGAVFISGIVFLLLTAINAWDTIIKAIPECLKHSIAAGIGLLITFIGLQYGGLVVASPGILVSLGDLGSAPVVVTLLGLMVTLILFTLNVKGAILLGILVSCLMALFLDVVQFNGIVAPIPTLAPTLLKLDIAGAFNTGAITIIFVFLFLDIFDTLGTLVGVTSQAGFIRDGRLPRANRAMLADAVGTATGALLGTSTVTSYVESSAGISQGGRTGFASIITGVLFLVALFFSPLAEMVGGTVVYNGAVLHPVIAPALIMVGFFMVKSITRIDWDNLTEAVPAFVVMIVMPFTLSITDGIGFGMIIYSVLMVVTGKSKEVHWLMYDLAVLFILKYILVGI